MTNMTSALLRRKIKALRAKSPPVPYRKICLQLHVVDAYGEPEPSLARLIERGFEPRKESTRARLGLPPKARRRSYHPNEEYMIWWRSSLRSNQRRAFIKSIWEMNKK